MVLFHHRQNVSKHYPKVIIKGYQINVIEYFQAICSVTKIQHDFDKIVLIPMEYSCLPNVEMKI